MLAMSERQVRAYEASGATGLVSKRRGKQSNRKLPEALRAAALELVREHYADFGPTAEKLREVHGLSPSVEALRKWMREAGLWTLETCVVRRRFVQNSIPALRGLKPP
jgi:hypothetical protein